MTTQTTTDRRGVKIDDHGYVADFTCHQDHTGNPRYSHSAGDHYVCSGCQTFAHVTTIRLVQAGAKLDGFGRACSTAQ